MPKPTPPPNKITKGPQFPDHILAIAIIVLASVLFSRYACAEVLTDPALVCAAAKTGDGAWLDLDGLKRCLASEKLRELDAKEIKSLRDALKVESAARQAAEASLLGADRRRWYYFSGGVSVGLLVTVLIVGAAS